jgi:dihydrofolate synthase/folylpolyglutamate synthase
MKYLLGHLGDPHRQVPSIHVAGSDGKGSTSAMIASILSSAGYKVGLYTSPHLHKITERIRIGTKPISESDFCSIVEEAWPAIEKTEKKFGHGGTTFFEAMTSLAFLHFQRSKADIQVVEVGLGGRLDATNVIAPKVCVITPISLDHVETLGATIGEIATEKAGIIKHRTPVVVACQTQNAMKSINQKAKEMEAPVISVSDRYTTQICKVTVDGQRFSIRGPENRYVLQTSLLGDYQTENASTAVAVAETVNRQGLNVTYENIQDGINRVDWPARFQVLRFSGKTVVVDGAHNQASLKRLSKNLSDTFGLKRVVLLFGALSGHSLDSMLGVLKGLDPSLVAVRSRHPKALDTKVISRAAKSQGIKVCYEEDTVSAGLERAISIGRNSVILGTGSLSVAAEILEDVYGIVPELYPNIQSVNSAVPAV